MVWGRPLAAFQIDSIQEGTAPAASAGAPLLHSRKLGGPGEWRAKARGRRPRTFHRAILPAIFWFLLHRCKRNSPPRRNLCFVLRCSACGRATFQRRKVTASSQSPLCSGHPGLGIPHAAPLLLLSNHEPLRWVHGWAPIAGLRARTQESCAVSLAFPAGAVPSGRVSNRYRYRSAQ